MNMNKKEAKLALVEISLRGFCDEFLNMEAEEPLAEIFEAAIECGALNLTRGDPDLWAAGIAYAFCRMNFLLDGGSPSGLSLSRDDFFTFFEDCNRSTVTQKATKIERALGFHHGHPLFSMPDVLNSMPHFVELSNGMISIERPIEISSMDEEESREFEEVLHLRAQEKLKKKQKAEAEQRRKRQEAQEKKREEERKVQPELFDL